MEELTDAAREAFPDTFVGQPFSSFSVFLEFLAHQASAQDAPVVAVIDELPYLSEGDRGLLTVLQHWWDDNKLRRNLKLFLAGSYTAFMERQVLDVNAPLYNRRTAAMKLEPMDYAGAGLFFPKYAAAEKMQAYAILGGMPSYLEQFDPAVSIAENVKSTILRQNTYLSEEPDWLLLQNLRKDTVYGSILRAIAHGERKPTDIARAIGRDSAQDIGAALDNLRGLGLVVREVPVTETRQSRSRNSLYWIDDGYIDFWYRFVDPSRSLVARGLGERLWTQSIEPNLQHYASRPAFERACRQFLWRELGADNLPADLDIANIGTWWGSGDREIDIVCVDAANKVLLVGECKWTNSPMDISDYASVVADIDRAGADLGVEASKLGTAAGPWIALFSRSGFDPRLADLAAAQDPSRLLLFSLDDMYAV